jgi:hypothetical protein
MNMRVVLLLLVLAVIGISLAQWLGDKPSNRSPYQESSTSGHLVPPTVPTHPQELKGFEKDMNRFIQDAATQQARQIEREAK